MTPDAVGAVDMEVQGSRLAFQGPAYHDKVSISHNSIEGEMLTWNRTGPIGLSLSLSRVGTGAMAAWDRTRSSGSTTLLSMIPPIQHT